MAHKLTEKQTKFVDYYIETGGNATEAARRAGYKKPNPQGCENLAKPSVKSAIDARLAELKSQRTADATEVLEYLTSVLRGQQEDETIVVEGVGDGCSRARRMNVKVATRDRNKAAELLGRVYGIYNDKLKLENAPVPVIVDDIDEGGDSHE
ncbi:terminase small subunit [Acidaminococcus fermentans]|uniref:terminase small subunit n=1 Tax=Acidaminococcus fermentans TaxID=905 RepID=UPI003F8A0AB4